MPLCFIYTIRVQERLICICLPKNDCDEASVNTCYAEQIGESYYNSFSHIFFCKATSVIIIITNDDSWVVSSRSVVHKDCFLNGEWEGCGADGAAHSFGLRSSFILLQLTVNKTWPSALAHVQRQGGWGVVGVGARRPPVSWANFRLKLRKHH